MADVYYDAGRDRPPPQDPPIAGLGFAALPLILWVMDDSAQGVAAALIAICMLIAALRLLARGHLLARRYEETPDARAPRLPRKLLGSLLMGGVVCLLALHNAPNASVAFGLGLIGAALSVMAFGTDPRRDKGSQALALSEDAHKTAAAGRTARDEIGQGFDGIIGDLHDLGDADLLHRLETLRDLMLGRLDVTRGDTETHDCMAARGRKILSMLTEETDRLLMEQGSERAEFARHRYAAKLDVLTRKIGGASHDPARAGRRGAVDKRADALFARMRRESSR